MKNHGKQILLACVAVAALGGFAVEIERGQFRRASSAKDAAVWFFDERANRLYAASARLIPPDGSEGNRVRANVVRFVGMPNDEGHVRIAYLEKYTPELKALLESAEAAHASRKPFAEKIPPQSSPYFRENTLLKRPGETTWHPLNGDEARQIVAEWHTWRGPNGELPMMSAPEAQ